MAPIDIRPNKLILPVTVIAVLGVSGLTILISTSRNLTSLESILLQLFLLVPGIICSYYLGNRAAHDVARTMVSPHARSAFRRLFSLYKSLSRMMVLIQATNGKSAEQISVTLAKIEAVLIEQIATADDALEDWRDIVPNEVEEMKQRTNS